MTHRVRFAALCLALAVIPMISADEPSEGYDLGRRAPDFELLDVEGRPVRLSEFRGRVVLLHFFTTW